MRLFLLTVGSFLLTVELFYLQLTILAFLLTIESFFVLTALAFLALQLERFLLTVGKCRTRKRFKGLYAIMEISRFCRSFKGQHDVGATRLPEL